MIDGFISDLDVVRPALSVRNTILGTYQYYELKIHTYSIETEKYLQAFQLKNQ